MQGIGRPVDQERPFANVKMGTKANSVGDDLNTISGRKENFQYADAKTHNKLGKDDFLKLLTHQLTNQDPTNPMDQKQFAADLAQFSSLEQLSNMNSSLAKQNDSKPLENKFYAASFLGKEVVTTGTTIDLKDDGEAKEVPFFLPQNAKNVMLRFFDSKNQMIGEVEQEDLGRGSHTIRWPGTALDGTPATKGSYTVQVRAWDDQYTEFKAETKTTGVVTDVTFENGETVLTIDGKKSIFLRDVETFRLLRDNKSSNDDVAKATEAYKKMSQ